jgi:PAP_fibrillin
MAYPRPLQIVTLCVAVVTAVWHMLTCIPEWRLSGALIAGTDRGVCASLLRHRQIQQLIDSLAALNPCRDAFESGKALLDGTWELLYSTAEPFRCALLPATAQSMH